MDNFNTRKPPTVASTLISIYIFLQIDKNLWPESVESAGRSFPKLQRAGTNWTSQWRSLSIHLCFWSSDFGCKAQCGSNMQMQSNGLCFIYSVRVFHDARTPHTGNRRPRLLSVAWQPTHWKCSCHKCTGAYFREVIFIIQWGCYTDATHKTMFSRAPHLSQCKTRSRKTL